MEQLKGHKHTRSHMKFFWGGPSNLTSVLDVHWHRHSDIITSVVLEAMRESQSAAVPPEGTLIIILILGKLFWWLETICDRPIPLSYQRELNVWSPHFKTDLEIGWFIFFLYWKKKIVGRFQWPAGSWRWRFSCINLYFCNNNFKSFINMIYLPLFCRTFPIKQGHFMRLVLQALSNVP